MDELIDVLDEKTGEKTGKVILKSVAHRNGNWHAAIHILIVNKDKSKTLLQKRSDCKDLYPSTWDIAVGGHIGSGENDIDSAKRELEEELGIKVDDKDLCRLEIVKEQLNSGGVVSNEFVSVFVVYADIDIADIKLQVDEVAEVKWCTYDELKKLMDSGKLFPHVREYEILKEILN
ncbi:MAG: NUDIX domain-containing protein [Oscillospiraceae bacterium]|nr:NUDIX domain-containing protein [Oscillospiraceae bacterium]